ncbi:MAG: hypothetical protein K2N84_06710 [Clostridia bacterium]|nr:hypothetical protein [Clostridia bacterium]
MALFAALRFCEDERIADKLYWYASDFNLQEGEDVLAPVGTHDRLQRATVERVLETDPEHAPYDTRFIKKVAARYGERRLAVGDCICFELGGLKYDGKRYTRYRRILFTSCVPREEEVKELRTYGVSDILTGSAEELAESGALAKDCVLLAGEHARAAASTLLACVRGEQTNLNERARKALLEKLC